MGKMTRAIVLTVASVLLILPLAGCETHLNQSPEYYTIARGSHNGGDFTISHTSATIGTTITLTVTSINDDMEFVRWTVAGDAMVNPVRQGTPNVWAFTMPAANITVSALFRSTVPATGQELFEALRGRGVQTGGWADHPSSGAGVTYANAASLTFISPQTHPDPVARRQAFTSAINTPNATHTFIIVSGDIDLSDGRITDEPGHFPGVTDTNVSSRNFHVSSNTTIIGINNARIMFGGLQIINRQNVIIRNLTFWDARDTRPSPGLDHLLVNNGSTGIWLDHLKFSSGLTPFNAPGAGDWHDTLLNVRHGAVTVSWSEFTNGNEVLLVGSNDNEIDPEQRRVTLHHNYFHGARTRMPRTRGTQMHIYNNFFRNIGAPGGAFGGGYVMGPGINAHFVVQNNLFEAPIHQNRVIQWSFNNHGAVVWHSGNEGLPLNPASLTGGGSPAPVLTTDVALRPWNPADFYAYALNSHGTVRDLRTLIPARAGPTLWTIEDFLTNLRD